MIIHDLDTDLRTCSICGESHYGTMWPTDVMAPQVHLVIHREMIMPCTQRPQPRLRHWRQGRHSRLPRCCILWFVLVWRHLPKWYHNRKAVRVDPYRPIEHQYVRCPVCSLLDRWSEQHICGPECSSS